MKVQKFSLSDARFERSPDTDARIFTANLVDQRHASPVTIGYGRYDPGQSLDLTLAVHDTMIVLEGSLTVTSNGETHAAGSGDIVSMPEGETVTIRSGDTGAVTAYVTFPHWQTPDDR